ncbi:MAG: hypothetical protein ACM3QU_13870 [Verrucomicrobiota bacterium]
MSLLFVDDWERASHGGETAAAVEQGRSRIPDLAIPGVLATALATLAVAAMLCRNLRA